MIISFKRFWFSFFTVLLLALFSITLPIFPVAKASAVGTNSLIKTYFQTNGVVNDAKINTPMIVGDTINTASSQVVELTESVEEVNTNNPTTIVPSNPLSISKTSGINFNNVITSDLPIKTTVSRDFTLSSCATNLKVSGDTSSTTYTITSKPNWGPDGLSCTSDDVSGWSITVSGTYTYNKADGGSMLLPATVFDMTTPPGAPLGQKITLKNTATRVTNEKNIKISSMSNFSDAVVTFINNPVVSQGIERDYTTQQVASNKTVSFNLIGFNDTTSVGNAVFTYQLNDAALKLNGFTLTPFGGATSATIETSNDGTTYTPYTIGQATPRYIRMSVASMPARWSGNIRIAMNTVNGVNNDTPGVSALQGTNSITTNIPSISIQSTLLIDVTPAVKITNTLTSTVDKNSNTMTDAGDQLIYKFTVTNTSVYSGLQNVAVSSPGGIVTGISCPKTTLAKDEVMDCSGVITLTETQRAAGNLTNLVKVDAVSVDDNNLTATANTIMKYTVGYTSKVGLSGEVLSGPAYQLGSVVKYSFTITNTGNEDLKTMKLSSNDLSNIDCDSDTITYGKFIICTAEHTVTEADLRAKAVKVDARVDAAGASSGTVVNAIISLALADTTAPQVNTVADQTVEYGDAISKITIGSTDPTVVLEVTGLPAGTTYNKDSNSITGTPTSLGSTTVTITATDVVGNKSEITFNIIVKDTVKPVLAPISNQTIELGEPMVNISPNATDVDKAIGYTVSGTTNGISYNKDSNTLGGTPTNTSVSKVVVNTSDSSGNVVEKSFTLTVLDSKSPLITAMPNQTIKLGQSITPTLVSINDASGDYSVRVDGMPNGVSYDSATSNIVGTPDAVGSYTLVVTATDSSDNTTSSSFVITVLPPYNPQVELTVTADKFYVYSAGTVVNFTYTVRNTGNITLDNLTFNNTLWGDIVCEGSTIEPGASITCSMNYTTTEADLQNASLAEEVLLTADSLGSSVNATAIKEVVVKTPSESAAAPVFTDTGII